MTDKQFEDMVNKYMPEIMLANYTDELYPSREVLQDLVTLFDYVLELKERLRNEKEKGAGVVGRLGGDLPVHTLHQG